MEQTLVEAFNPELPFLMKVCLWYLTTFSSPEGKLANYQLVKAGASQKAENIKDIDRFNN